MGGKPTYKQKSIMVKELDHSELEQLQELIFENHGHVVTKQQIVSGLIRDAIKQEIELKQHMAKDPRWIQYKQQKEELDSRINKYATPAEKARLLAEQALSVANSKQNVKKAGGFKRVKNALEAPGRKKSSNGGLWIRPLDSPFFGLFCAFGSQDTGQVLAVI